MNVVNKKDFFDISIKDNPSVVVYHKEGEISINEICISGTRLCNFRLKQHSDLVKWLILKGYISSSIIVYILNDRPLPYKHPYYTLSCNAKYTTNRETALFMIDEENPIVITKDNISVLDTSKNIKGLEDLSSVISIKIKLDQFTSKTETLIPSVAPSVLDGYIDAIAIKEVMDDSNINAESMFYQYDAIDTKRKALNGKKYLSLVLYRYTTSEDKNKKISLLDIGELKHDEYDGTKQCKIEFPSTASLADAIKELTNPINTYYVLGVLIKTDVLVENMFVGFSLPLTIFDFKRQYEYIVSPHNITNGDIEDDLTYKIGQNIKQMILEEQE